MKILETTPAKQSIAKQSIGIEPEGAETEREPRREYTSFADGSWREKVGSANGAGAGADEPSLQNVAKYRAARVKGEDVPVDAAAKISDAQKLSIKDVPGVADLEGLKSGDLNAASVEGALKTALLSGDPIIRARAAKTIQVAESYARKANADRENYAGTGFTPFSFPEFRIQLSKSETASLVMDLFRSWSEDTVNILAMASKAGLLRTDPPATLEESTALNHLRTEHPARLPASEGQESPRGTAKSFDEDWHRGVKPGLDTIESVIIETAKAGGCPFAHGNHAKGVAFSDAKLELAPTAPPWMRDLLGGNSLEGGMIRISGSQTDPNQPDQEAHQTGIRVVFPVNGKLDGSATQLIDLTANTGNTTHAKTATEHTIFSQDITVPKDGLAHLTAVRASKHLFKAATGEGRVVDRVSGILNALKVTKLAGKQRFHEHDLFSRHAFFVAGRYVQVRFAVESPQNFDDPNDSKSPNARIEATERGIAKSGLALGMYITEIPEGRPELAEQEGWENLPETKVATIALPPQDSHKGSEASQWFKEVPHVPVGSDKIFHGVGLARHRAAIYERSGEVRNRTVGD